MAKVGSGVLSLQVKKDPSRRGDVCKWKKPGTSKKFKFPYYLNGHVGTDLRFTFRYGTAAARVKFQKPRGMHGSFWMNARATGSTCHAASSRRPSRAIGLAAREAAAVRSSEDAP